MRQFLWEGPEGFGDNMVSWEMVSVSKSKGSLGIGSMNLRNIALLLSV